MALFLKFTLLITIFTSSAATYKILGLFPHPGKSHLDVFVPLMKGLVDQGHQVTVISPFPQPVAFHPNYTDINLASLKPPSTNDQNEEVIDVNAFEGRHHRWLTPSNLHQFGKVSCEEGLATKEVQELIRHPQHFDVIIAEFFNSDCFLGFAHKLKAPVIGLSSCPILPWANERLGNPSHPAYIPNVFMDYSDHMTFLERLENLVFGYVSEWYYRNVVLKDNDEIAKRYFGNDLPPLLDLALNSSLLLVNTHFALNLPRPLVPSVVEIGGIHIKPPKDLPNNIEKWIMESANGVIYFSLGSMIKGHTFPEEKRQEFLRAFGRLPQRVLWKWENDSMPGKPDNVMIQKWMPQLDILCHPNVVGFISHGGLLGTTEAVHCGVPVVVMPQYGDQHTNARALEANGGGVILSLREATEEKVYRALETILDPGFQRQAKELSERFRDRPLPPLQTAIYWVEYVARHRGARHMRTAAVDMPFYKYLLLDVLAFLLLVAVVLAAIFFYVTRAVLRKLLGKGSGSKQKKH